MAIIKSDTYTALNQQKNFYSDFPNSFTFSPVGDELGRVVNERSVTQSIKNLIFTIFGERLFQPTVGSNIYGSNFELNDNITDLIIAQNITNTIQTFEKRCNLISVSVDSNPDNYEIDVTIKYSIINNNSVTINLTLQRIR